VITFSGIGGYSPLRDRSLAAWSLVWTVAVLAVFGIVTAIIPNPVFGRGLPPESFAVAVWLVSSPLMGVLMATYFAPAPGLPAQSLASTGGRDGTRFGMLGSVAAFLAIGCPTCNKIALVLLGAGGAASIFGPIQPVIGAVSIVLLSGTLMWRMRLRARGGGCAVPARRALGE
jgi:hypothetical protein